MMAKSKSKQKSEHSEAEIQSAEILETHGMQAEIETLQQQIEEANTKSNEYLEGWQRARAEFANYKKRMEREQSEAYQRAVGSITKRYLDVVDDLDRALQNRPQEGEGAAWANGIELIYRKLLVAMENDGIKVMNTDGADFDPNFHEAITSEDSDQHQSGQIIGVLQKGYLIGDRVLRPALVRVAR